jgi:hypothetical protein
MCKDVIPGEIRKIGSARWGTHALQVRAGGVWLTSGRGNSNECAIHIDV